MTKRMLIDGTHPEEVRVVITSANRLEEYDVETSTKRQLKGNIYLAKVTRVEPSLQAAFVDFGGDRHGFLAFNDIHPDYFQIPVEDREALVAAENAEGENELTAQALVDEIDSTVEDISETEDPDAEEGGPAESEPEAAIAEAVGAPEPDTVAGEPPEEDSPGIGPGGPGRGSRRCRRHGRGRRRGGGSGRGRVRAGIRGRRRGGRGKETFVVAQAPPRTQAERCRCRRRIPPGQQPVQALQDPGSHQAEPDHPGPGGQGGAGQQGGRADHLYFACRPLLRADAQHRARRRYLPQDHQPERAPQAEEDHRRSGNPERHGRDHAHRRHRAKQGGNQARLRVFEPQLGRRARSDVQFDRSDPGLRGCQPDKARDPRSLHQGRGGSAGRRGGSLSDGQEIHADADAEPRQARPALPGSRHPAIPPLSDRGPAGRDPQRGGAAQVRRLYRHPGNRGPGVDRRELGPLDARAQHRGDRSQHQRRGGRGGRPPAEAARPCRDWWSSISSTCRKRATCARWSAGSRRR